MNPAPHPRSRLAPARARSPGAADPAAGHSAPRSPCAGAGKAAGKAHQYRGAPPSRSPERKMLIIKKGKCSFLCLKIGFFFLFVLFFWFIYLLFACPATQKGTRKLEGET